jgi:hypothetical protein
MRGRVRGCQGGIRRGARRAGVIAGLVLALTGGLAAAPIGGLSAVAATSTTKAITPTTTKASSTDKASSTAKPVTTETQAPVNPKSVHPASQLERHAAKPTALSVSQIRQAETEAARQAIADTTVPDTCSGPIEPDTTYPCTTPSSAGTDTFTLNVATVPDVLLIRTLQANSFNSAAQPITLTAPDSTTVTCQQPIQLYECPVTQAGTYTLAVTNGGSDYTLAYSALLEPSANCPAIDPSFAAAPVQDTAAAGAAGNCYGLNMPAGDVLLASTVTQPNAITVAVYDASGNLVCVDDSGECTLTGTGPYRVFVSSFYGEAETYDLELNDISNPQGCAAASQLTYGQVPSSSSNLCRALTVTTAGTYQLYAAGPGVPDMAGTLYTAATSTAPPSVVCTVNGTASCTLAAGTYYFVAAADYPPLVSFGLGYIAATAGTGCVATGDTDFASGPAKGTFTGPGEEICLTLPTAAGSTDYFFNQPTSNGTTPQVEVIDATGAQLCAGAVQYGYATCTLTGTAPFRVILYGQNAGGGYQYLVQRSNSTAGCSDWPQSGFGGTWGATATLTASNDVKCLTIPAGQHSTGEMIDYSNIPNKVDATLYVNDPTGTQVCAGSSTAICAYNKSVTYTALLVTVTTSSSTYNLVRRDVSATANCARPASTKVGGPSTTFTLTSDLDSLCYRVTGAATDDLWFSVRALGPSPSGAVLLVTNASGDIACRQFGVPCRVSGSTSYQVIVTANNYMGVAITAHLDTWLVGTASGWASQCTAHQYSVTDGIPVITGTLNEQTTAYCAVVNVQPNQVFDIAGWDSAVYPQAPEWGIYRSSDFTSLGESVPICWAESAPQISQLCNVSPTATAGQALLVVDLSGDGAQSPVRYALQGLCWITSCAKQGNLQANFATISPASQPAGPDNTVVITGSNLSFATNVQLYSGDSSDTGTANGIVTSVNAAGTSMTVSLNTSGLTPGKYDITAEEASCSPPTPTCPGYLLNAYTVTAGPSAPAASTFTAVTPARILDTRSGLGASKAKVPGNATVTLTVAGKGGVPASNVTAVALDVTAVTPQASGYLIAYPAGTTRPATTTDLSFTAGATRTNLVIVALNGGKLSLYNASGKPLNLVADVAGYYTAGASGSTLTTTGPSRILDTRNGTGARKARVAAHGTLDLTVAGKAGVPATGATAVVLNVVAVSPTAGGSLTIFPNGKSLPTATALTFAKGVNTYGLVVVPIGRNGEVNLYNASGGTVDLVADVDGYYGAGGASFAPFGPTRILDTRSGLGGSGQTVLPHAAAVIPGVTNAIWPDTLSVSSVVLEVTVTGAQDAGTLTAFSDGTSLPAPTFSYAAGQTVTALVILPDVNGNVDFYNGSSGTVQVIADLVGYYGS